jgi:hypothetical protein
MGNKQIGHNGNNDSNVELVDDDYLKQVVLLAYLFDYNCSFNFLPSDIINYILRFFLSSKTIEFEYSEKTSKRYERYRKGRKYPFSIRTQRSPFLKISPR